MPRPKIAIVGSGITGLSAAWHLHPNADVTIFEKSNYVGGHSNTVDVCVEGKTLPVDTGFIVFNPQNYPNLTALFDFLNVKTVATDMSFAVSMDQGGFEYSGGDNAGLLAQPFNAIRPRFWQMIVGILRFYRNAGTFEQVAEAEGLSLGELLDKYGFSSAFIEGHLAPMGAAIWSSDSTDILEYPAADFIRFFRNHGLVQINDRPQWRTVVGGSREYVKKLSANFKDRIRLNTGVSRIERKDGGVTVYSAGSAPEHFDQIVLACHSDQALALLGDPSAQEAEILGSMRYSRNTAVLHTERNWLPKRQRAWASWNYMEAPKGADRSGPAITYWMNRLQHLPVETPVMVTLNPYRDVAPDHILGSFDYEHPIFDRAARAARDRLMHIQGAQQTWFAGAYMGNGFHEDGIQAGLAVAEMISGTERPWFREGQNARIGLPDQLIQPQAVE